MEYFTKSYLTAKRKADRYRNNTQAQRSNLGFCAAGNLSRASAKRLVTIRNVHHSLYTKQCIKEVMLKISEVELFRVSGAFGNGQPFVRDIQWVTINTILDRCQETKYISDSFEYSRVSFMSNNFYDKLEAIKVFVEKYGTKTDIKYLIPKLTPTTDRQLKLL